MVWMATCYRTSPHYVDWFLFPFCFIEREKCPIQMSMEIISEHFWVDNTYRSINAVGSLENLTHSHVLIFLTTCKDFSFINFFHYFGHQLILSVLVSPATHPKFVVYSENCVYIIGNVLLTGRSVIP